MELFQSSGEVLSFLKLTINLPEAPSLCLQPVKAGGGREWGVSLLSCPVGPASSWFKSTLLLEFSKELLQPVRAENQPCASSNGKLAVQSCLLACNSELKQEPV